MKLNVGVKMVGIALLMVSSLAMAHEHKGHDHGHGAKRRQHGAANLAIAFEGAKGKIEFKSPSDGVIGFEHEAKSDKDKATQQIQLAKLETAMPEMVAFDASLGCKLTKVKVDVVVESHDEEKTTDSKKKSKHNHAAHSDTVAEFDVACDKNPEGTELIFNVQQHFPKVKNVSVQVITDNLQKAISVKKNATKLVLK